MCSITGQSKLPVATAAQTTHIYLSQGSAWMLTPRKHHLHHLEFHYERNVGYKCTTYMDVKTTLTQKDVLCQVTPLVHLVLFCLL